MLRLLFVDWINSFCKEMHDPYANFGNKEKSKKKV